MIEYEEDYRSLATSLADYPRGLAQGSSTISREEMDVIVVCNDYDDADRLLHWLMNLVGVAVPLPEGGIARKEPSNEDPIIDPVLAKVPSVLAECGGGLFQSGNAVHIGCDEMSEADEVFAWLTHISKLPEPTPA